MVCVRPLPWASVLSASRINLETAKSIEPKSQNKTKVMASLI